jgi:hypothetical protein
VASTVIAPAVSQVLRNSGIASIAIWKLSPALP